LYNIKQPIITIIQFYIKLQFLTPFHNKIATKLLYYFIDIVTIDFDSRKEKITLQANFLSTKAKYLKLSLLELSIDLTEDIAVQAAVVREESINTKSNNGALICV